MMCDISCFFTFVLVSFLYLNEAHSPQTDWELNQFKNVKIKSIENYSTLSLKTTEEVIKSNKDIINQWMTKETIPGLVIGLSIKGKNIWTESFGEIDIENKIPTHKQSVWRLASISKPLTSALVAQLIDKGLLRLNDSIHKYLSKDLFPIKGFGGKGVKITIRQVLSHMAGLHLTKIPDDFSKLFKAQNVSQTIPGLKDEKLLFMPGTEYSYSNYGYQIAGAIIESVLNSTYQNEIRKMCLSLGMNSTFAENPDTIYNYRPRYYQMSKSLPGQLERADIIDQLFSYEGWWPSGGMISTVEDLLIFGNSMLSSFEDKNKNFLSKSIVEELWKPETIGKPKSQNMNDNEYAKGWTVKQIASSVDYPYKRLIWHSGGLLGSSTMFFIFPDVKIVGVAFTNRGVVMGLDQIVLMVAQSFGSTELNQFDHGKK